MALSHGFGDPQAAVDDTRYGGVRNGTSFSKGDRVKVVRGRKVPIGTEGFVIWIGDGQWGERCGIKDAKGDVHWTAVSNVADINAIVEPRPARKRASKRPRCLDCGEPGKSTGHMECQYPQNR